MAGRVRATGAIVCNLSRGGAADSQCLLLQSIIRTKM